MAIPSVVFLDESGYCFGSSDDPIRVTLRSCEGIPNAIYDVHSDGRVFVFDKLVNEVRSRKKEEDDIGALGLSLLDSAKVSAIEAVRNWGVIPVNYKVELTESGYMIVHVPLNSRIPTYYSTEADLKEALAKILVGGVIDCQGDFTYGDQQLSLLESLDPADLPSIPELTVTDSENVIDNDLQSILPAFRIGFDPLTKVLYEKINAIGVNWHNSKTNAFNVVITQAGSLLANPDVYTLMKDALQGPSQLMEDEVEIIGHLRQLYPELIMISDRALLSCGEDFFEDMANLEPYRSEEFLLHVVAALCDASGFAHEMKETEHWFAYGVISGKTIEESVAFAKNVIAYDLAIGRLLHRVRSAILFLNRDDANLLRGSAIVVPSDVFASARSKGFSMIFAEQSLNTPIKKNRF